MGKIIQRYVRKEILSPFILSLFVFTFVLLMQNALDLSEMVIARGIAFSSTMQILLYTLPSLLWLSIPMAFLMAALIGLGRLASDNEIIAMNALGIGKGMFLKPVLTLGFLLFAISFFIGTIGIPWGGVSLNQLMYRLLQESATSGIQARTFNDHFSDLVIYTDSVDPKKNRLGKIIIADYRGEIPESIFAQNGTIQTDPKTMTNRLTLTNGSVHQYDMTAGRYRLIHFKEYSLTLSTDVESERQYTQMSKKDPSKMTLTQLKETASAADLENRKTFQMHYHEKFSIPFSCVVFGLIAIPFGIRTKRSGKFIGFAWSLMIIFLYYILLGIGRNFGSEGMVPPELAAWLPNGVLGIIGILLFVQASGKVESGREEGRGLTYWLSKIRRFFVK